MRSVREIVRDLGKIPHALLPAAENPYSPPRIIFDPERMDTIESIQIDIDDDLEYPDWAETQIFRGLDDAVKGEPASGSCQPGIDAIAWYVSFHHAHGPWGIFIPVKSLAYLESRIFSGLEMSRSEKWQRAFQLLYEHEYMHFTVDYLTSQWELLLKAPCWASLHDRLRRSSESYLQIEELLANAHMLRSCRSMLDASTSTELNAFIASQPPGYRDASAAISDDSFSRVFAETIQSYTGLFALERGIDWRAEAILSFQSPQLKLASLCPVHIIPDESEIGLPPNAVRIFTRIAEADLVETDSFKKDLDRLDLALKNSWQKRKKLLESAIPRFPDFEKLKGQKGIFSLRLNDNFRVHLRLLPPDKWEAFAVGSHKAMRHG